MIANPTPARTWTATPRTSAAFPDPGPALLVVEYTDGTGNVYTPDGTPLYVPGTPFSHEPSGHLDPVWYVVVS